MPTPSEQKALAFIAIVALLGGAVRVVRANSAPLPTPAEQQGIARQAIAAESASTKAKAAKKGRGVKISRDTTVHVVGGVASVPATRSPFGYPPPGPRIDVDYRTPAPRVAAPPSNVAKAPTAKAPTIGRKDSLQIDVDVASEAEIEKLARIGPAMAKKIVANRDSFGPFKTLENLRRVKGIGPSTLQLIAGQATFSGRRAPPP